MKDSNATIFKSLASFLSGTLISRVSGLLRDVAMAYVFGTSSAIAALMVAFRFAHLFRRLLGEGALQSAFIPKFEEIRKEDEARAMKFFCGVTVSLAFVLFVIVLLCMAGMICGYCISFSPETQEIFFLTLILLPSLFFICLYGLNSALLQCEKQYFIPSAAPVAFNIVWLAGTLLVLPFTPEEGVLWLAGCIVFACIAQWAMTLPSTCKIMKKYHSYPSLSGLFSLDVKRLFGPLFLAVAGVAATQVNNALDPLFARYVDAEGPAFLWYAMRLEQLPLSLFGIALSSALLPPLARAAKRGDTIAYRNFLSLAIHRCILFVTPMAFAFWVAGDSCVNLIFGYGDFGADSVAYTAQSLGAYAVGLIPTALVLIMAPAFYALDEYRLPALSTATAVLLNIALNSLFTFVLGWGAAAVALATSISSWGNFLMLSIRLQKMAVFAIDRRLYRMTVNIVLASLASSLLVVAGDAFFFGGNGMFVILANHPLEMPSMFSEKLTRFLVEALLFALPVTLCWWRELRMPSYASQDLDTPCASSH